MKKWLSLAVVSMLVVGILAACGTKDEKTSGDGKKVLTMGTSADYKPFEYVDTKNGEDPIGFDIDLANAIAKKLGYKVEVQDMDLGGLIPAIQADQVDFVMAGMTPTEKRKKNVDFTDVYYTAKDVIITPKNSGIKSVDDLKGKTIGVQASSIQEDKAKELNKTTKFKIENRNRIPDIIQEIKSDRFDAAIIEDTVAKGYLDKEKDLTGIVISDDKEDEAGSAIAFPKDSKLTKDFNRVLNEMKENGELDKLIVKWFGGDQ